jgi:cathepsin B
MRLAIFVVAAILCGAVAAHVDLKKPAVNWEIIRKVNANPKSTWKAGHNNKFDGMSLSEVKRYLGVKKNGFVLPRKEFTPLMRAKAGAIPTSFDSRMAWPKCTSIGEVRDQSDCGSCWAFGAVEAMTDRVCIASNGTKKTHLSAEDMTACCTFCGNGCDGGNPAAAWNYWVNEGVVDGGNYGGGGCAPYTLPECDHHVKGKRPPCPGQEYPTPNCPSTCSNGKDFMSSKVYGSTAYSIDSAVADIQTEIMTNGPVEVAFSVYEDFLQYKTGVYYYQSGQMLGGHAVKMLGWGVWPDGSVPYWIVANSWNDDWGNKGFFLIRQGTDECGIEDDVQAGEPK